MDLALPYQVSIGLQLNVTKPKAHFSKAELQFSLITLKIAPYLHLIVNFGPFLIGTVHYSNVQ